MIDLMLDTPIGALVVVKDRDGQVFRSKTLSSPAATISGLTVRVEGVAAPVRDSALFVLPAAEERVSVEVVIACQTREAQMRGLVKPPGMVELEASLRSELRDSCHTLEQWQEIITKRATLRAQFDATRRDN